MSICALFEVTRSQCSRLVLTGKEIVYEGMKKWLGLYEHEGVRGPGRFTKLVLLLQGQRRETSDMFALGSQAMLDLLYNWVLPEEFLNSYHAQLHFQSLSLKTTMQFSSFLLAALASIAAAAPLDSSMSSSSWTMKSFTRTCPNTGTCKYAYSIYDGMTTTPCSYTVKAANASTATYGPETCGTFTITSSWSGQFGPGNGFQVLAVKGEASVIYPGYTDKQLASGVTVTPDQSYTPQAST
ncbi:hypothetical protein MMC26_005567 [Xylographa opegraphella]|nr:hypothetical protein [Xylographa opegraphella]